MFNFNISQIANSFSIFSFNYSAKNEIISTEIELTQKNDEKEIMPRKKREYKNILEISKIKLIENYNEDICIYFFIQKESSNHSSWNLILPLVKGLNTNRLLQYRLGNFCLQGGSRLLATKNIFYSANKLRKKGYKVYSSAKIIDNNLLDDFLYLDTELTLNSLDKKSELLYHYCKIDPFEGIFNQYKNLVKENSFDDMICNF